MTTSAPRPSPSAGQQLLHVLRLDVDRVRRARLEADLQPPLVARRCRPARRPRARTAAPSSRTAARSGRGRSRPRVSPGRMRALTTTACTPRSRARSCAATSSGTPFGHPVQAAARARWTYLAIAPWIVVAEAAAVRDRGCTARGASAASRASISAAVSLTTRSPSGSPSRPCPSAAISPQNSWPRITGRDGPGLRVVVLVDVAAADADRRARAAGPRLAGLGHAAFRAARRPPARVRTGRRRACSQRSSG